MLPFGRPQLTSFPGATEQSDPAYKSLCFLLGLNVKIFSALLQLLLDDLREATIDESANAGIRLQQFVGSISASTKRVLPMLRLCSCWLVANHADLVLEPMGLRVSRDIQAMWSTYADVLTGIVTTFAANANAVPQLSYLLEEDADTLGFNPLESPETRSIWYDTNGAKPRKDDVGIRPLSDNDEILCRVRDILLDGLQLTQIEVRVEQVGRASVTDRIAGLSDIPRWTAGCFSWRP